MAWWRSLRLSALPARRLLLDDADVQDESADSCEAPELESFALSNLKPDEATCATAGAVAVAATECYFASRVAECPRVDVGGARWQCAFQVIGPAGSGGRAQAECLAHGGSSISFQAERVAP